MFDRCLAIARSHSLLSNPQNALALLARASEKCDAAYSYISSSAEVPSPSPPNISTSPSEVQFLKNLLDGEMQRYRALVELHNLDSKQKISEISQPLVEHLNDYPPAEVTLSNLVRYPPKLEPVPVKPLFFDAAWNYIEYPGREVEKVRDAETRESVISTKAMEQMPQQRKGWFGFGR